MYEINSSVIIATKTIDFIAWTLQIIGTSLLTYIIARTKKMEIYRWYLINELVWRMLADTTLLLASPSILSPYFYILINSVFENYLSLDGWTIVLELLLLFAFNLLLSICLSTAFRICSLLNITKIIELMSKPKNIVVLVLTFQVMLIALLYFGLESRRSIIIEQSLHHNGTEEIFDNELQGRKVLCKRLILL